MTEKGQVRIIASISTSSSNNREDALTVGNAAADGSSCYSPRKRRGLFDEHESSSSNPTTSTLKLTAEVVSGSYWEGVKASPKCCSCSEEGTPTSANAEEEQEGAEVSSCSFCYNDDDTTTDEDNNNNNKRLKMLSEKRVVRFDEQLVTFIQHAPYVQGQQDADVLQMCSNEIWYTHKDYATFLKDRIDTIHVYRSVNGDMSCLGKHYTVRGLEPFVEGYYTYNNFQQKQRRFMASVVHEQYRMRQQEQQNHYVDPEALREYTSLLSQDSIQQALRRAQEDFNEAGSDEELQQHEVEDPNHQHDDDSDDEDASDAESSCGVDESRRRHVPYQDGLAGWGLAAASRITVSTNPVGGVGMMMMGNRHPSAPRHNRHFPVNVTSLRRMNLKLMQDIKANCNSSGHHTKVTTTTPQLLDAAVPRRQQQQSMPSDFSAKIDEALNEVDQELEQWSNLLLVSHHDRRQSSSQAARGAGQQRPFVQTNRGGFDATSDVRCDSLSLAKAVRLEYPSLVSLQQQTTAKKAALGAAPGLPGSTTL